MQRILPGFFYRHVKKIASYQNVAKFFHKRVLKFIMNT